MEVPPPVTGGTLQEEVVASWPPTISGVEKRIPSDKVVGEAEQVFEVVKDAKSM